jgi:hypothetical protein
MEENDFASRTNKKSRPYGTAIYGSEWAAMNMRPTTRFAGRIR